MPTLKCTKCEKTFKTWMIFVRGAVFGWGGIGLGAIGLIMPIWPLALKVYAKCRNCGEVTWLKVLKPTRSDGGKS